MLRGVSLWAALALMPLPTLGQEPPDTIPATIQRHCAQEWPDDARMRTFCSRQQNEAVVEKGSLVRSSGGIPAEAFGVVLDGCEGEWPGDYRMQVFCLKQQIEGHGDVSRGPESPNVQATAEERAQIQRHCDSEWPDDFRMKAFCERRQIEALGFLKSSNSPRKATCRREWPSDFAMQEFCVRNGDTP